MFLGSPVKDSAKLTFTSQETEEEPNPIEDIKETAALAVSSRMLMVTPLIIWSAISLAFFGSIFVGLMTRTLQELPDYKDDTNK